MSKHFANRPLAAGAVLLLAACPGCGTGEYETRLEQTVTELRQESPFIKDMHPPKTLPDTPVTFQLPKIFKLGEKHDNPLQEKLKPDDPHRAIRLKPPFEGLNLSGLKETYEAFFEYQGGSKIAYYCYVAAADLSAAGTRDPSRALRNQLYALWPDTPRDWESVDCATPEGRATEWKRIRCTGEQDFYYLDENGNPDPRKAPGTLEFYNCRIGDWMVLIVWRVPTDIKGPQYVGLDKWAPLVAGSVTAKQGAD